MSATPWQAAWFRSAQPARRDLWRGVEAQHQVATMRLVDDLHEQELLEQLLEASKPPLPPEAQGAHYLLFTPFRYVSPWPSRFRPADRPGVWYGADAPETVAAEIAHWRWRFLMDSDGLRDTQVIATFTFFTARFTGLELDLMQAPWSARRARWRDPGDYAACHKLAQVARAREPAVAAIRYESARREGHACEAVFDAGTLTLPKSSRQQTWTCKTSKDRVLFVRDGVKVEFVQGGAAAS